MTVERLERYAFKNGHEQGLTEGIITGNQQKALETAENLLKMNVLTAEQIAQGTGLPLEQVLELQKKISVTI